VFVNTFTYEIIDSAVNFPPHLSVMDS